MLWVSGGRPWDGMTLCAAAGFGTCSNASGSAAPANERFHYRCKPRRTRWRKTLSCW